MLCWLDTSCIDYCQLQTPLPALSASAPSPHGYRRAGEHFGSRAWRACGSIWPHPQHIAVAHHHGIGNIRCNLRCSTTDSIFKLASHQGFCPIYKHHTIGWIISASTAWITCQTASNVSSAGWRCDHGSDGSSSSPHQAGLRAQTSDQVRWCNAT